MRLASASRILVAAVGPLFTWESFGCPSGLPGQKVLFNPKSRWLLEASSNLSPGALPQPPRPRLLFYEMKFLRGQKTLCRLALASGWDRTGRAVRTASGAVLGVGCVWAPLSMGETRSAGRHLDSGCPLGLRFAPQPSPDGTGPHLPRSARSLARARRNPREKGPQSAFGESRAKPRWFCSQGRKAWWLMGDPPCPGSQLRLGSWGRQSAPVPGSVPSASAVPVRPTPAPSPAEIRTLALCFSRL